MTFPKYKYLLTYRYAEILCNLGVIFSNRFYLGSLGNLSPLGNLSELPVLPENPEKATNFLLTLLHIETFLLSKQIKSAENKFLSGGGYTEKLYNKRIEFRSAEELKKIKTS